MIIIKFHYLLFIMYFVVFFYLKHFFFFWFIRLLNKKESEDQAHIYIPAERKLKFEEPPRRLGHREQTTEISSNIKPKNLVTTNQPVNDQQQEPMDFELNENETTMKYQKTGDATKIVKNKKKPVLTDEDLNNFKNSISYVSKIPHILSILLILFLLFIY